MVQYCLKIIVALNLGPIWYPYLSNNFYISNTLTHIFTDIFTHTYFKKLQKSYLKLLYQTPLLFWSKQGWRNNNTIIREYLYSNSI